VKAITPTCCAKAASLLLHEPGSFLGEDFAGLVANMLSCLVFIRHVLVFTQDDEGF
jgi:hypothetical protein